MTRFPLLLCGLALAVALAAASIGLAQTAPGKADPLAANAALLYWRAFAVLPKLDEKQDKTLVDVWCYLKPVEDSLGPIVKMSAPALRELHRGAQQPRCVWGTPIGDGMSTLIPHGQKARELARLAVVRARWNFAHGKPAEGVDDLTDALTLARNIGTDLHDNHGVRRLLHRNMAVKMQ